MERGWQETATPVFVVNRDCQCALSDLPIHILERVRRVERAPNVGGKEKNGMTCTQARRHAAKTVGKRCPHGPASAAVSAASAASAVAAV